MSFGMPIRPIQRQISEPFWVTFYFLVMMFLKPYICLVAVKKQDLHWQN